MPALDARILALIEELLSKRPPVATGTCRDDSWMTAPEISLALKQVHDIDVLPDAVETMLLCQWRANPTSSVIRPAKYPGENTMLRLWGHVACVGLLPADELQSFRNDVPLELERLQQAPDAPVCFISFAAPDLHFAARVRLFIGGLGIKTWLYAREIQERELVFEGVRAAIERSDVLIALITPQSIASAWVWTECSFATGINRPVVHVFDASNRSLMALLQTWEPPKTAKDVNFSEVALAALRDEYRRFNHERRLVKFDVSTKDFLFAMSSFRKCIYPTLPASAALHESFLDFEPVMTELLAIGRLPPADGYTDAQRSQRGA
jgi:hypothetical protein